MQYTLEDPSVEGDLRGWTMGLDLLQALLPQQPSRQPPPATEAAAEAASEAPDGRLTISTVPSAAADQPLVASMEQQNLIADLFAALPAAAAMQCTAQGESDSESHASSGLEEADRAAADSQSGLQASTSNLTSSEGDQQDFMRLISMLLASASGIGTAGLKPLLGFPSLLHEHLKSEQLNCEVGCSCHCCSGPRSMQGWSCDALLCHRPGLVGSWHSLHSQ